MQLPTENKFRLGCFGWGVIIFVGIIFLLWCLGSLSNSTINQNTPFPTSEEPGSPSPEASTDLSPEIHWNGSQLIITDKDDFDYNNAVIELDGDYTYKVGQPIEAGQTYTIGLMEFANSDGIRFNPFQMKIKTIFVSSDEGTAYLENIH